MASAAALSHRGGVPKPAAPLAANQPAGTFSPGTKVQVGNHRVTIERYLSEGGFAHVYVVRVPRDNNKYELAVLKRVAVPDKGHLANMRTEVETMKKLKGHRHVVTYMDSHASQLKGGGYEVFLLMEFCGGGGLIDFMNTRLQHRLTEPEILKIFGDVAEGLAAMHYLKPPLLHRDLKVENVLISKTNSGSPLYKLCDFGSAAVPRPAATTPEEGRLIEEDVQQHTTMQYRSPEMIDVWRKQPINEKADIWALGVFLYKLCYYTTPFEDVGQMAILNASYKYPAYPAFSDRLKKFIAWMLKEDPRQRPNIYQVIQEACGMRGTEVPIKDIYADRTLSEAQRNEALPSPDLPTSPPVVGLQKTAPKPQAQALPDIAPMRRGRPTGPALQAATAAQSKPASSPAKGDPFAALDSKNYNVRAEAVDELSKRFPSLDEFSITQESPSKFPFSKPSVANEVASAANTRLSERVTQALADEAFARSKPLPTPSKSMTDPQLSHSKASPPKQMTVAQRREKLDHTPLVHQPTPVRPGTTYTSRGVGSSPPPVKPNMPNISSRPIWRVPDSNNRSSSQPRASIDAENAAALLKPGPPRSERPALTDLHRSKSSTATQSAFSLTTSSRPSLETRRPTTVDLGEPELTRARSAQNRSRPSSMYLDSNIDFLRDQESSQRQSFDGKRDSRNVSSDNRTSTDEQNINADIDFLRTSEDAERPRSHRKMFGHKKRTSLGNALGRFGDAFKRRDSSQGKEANDLVLVTPDPEQQDSRLLELSPIEGSEATPSKHSDDLDFETEDLPADVKRELERRRQLEEERRVAEGAAHYRARVAHHGTGTAAPTRASTIQQRVQSLLDEGRQSPVKRTAEGYGRYTEVEEQAPPQPPRPHTSVERPTNAPPVARKPAAIDISNNPYTRTRPATTQSSTPPNVTSPNAGTFTGQSQARIVTRPSVPPKSSALRTGGSTMMSPTSEEERPPQPPRPSGGLAALLAKDLEGVPDYPPRGSSMVDSNSTVAVNSRADDPELDFEKRYPSLAGIELVETEIGGPGRSRVRDV